MHHLSQRRLVNSFPFSEEFLAFHFGYIFVSGLDEGFCFLERGCDFSDVIVAFPVHKVRVNQRVFDVLMAEELHYVKNIFGLVVFHCDFEMS